MFRVLTALALTLALAAQVRAASLEDFASGPAVTDIAISESGRYVAFVGPDKGYSNTKITVLDFAAGGTPKGYAIPVPGFIAHNVVWKGDSRLIAQVVKHDVPVSGVSSDHPLHGETASLLRTLAMNPDGSAPVVIFGDNNRLLKSALVGQPISSLMVDDPEHILMQAFDGQSVGLYKANVMTGEVEVIERGERFGGSGRAKDRVGGEKGLSVMTVGWMADPKGVAWLRIDEDLVTDEIQLRARATGDSQWRLIKRFYDTGDTNPEFVPITLAEGGQSFYAATRGGQDKFGVYEIRMSDGAVASSIYSRPDVDVGAFAINDSPIAVGLTNAYTGKLNGVRYAIDAPQVHYLNANWGKAHQMLAEALPGLSIHIVGHSRDFGRVLVAAVGPSTPATYHLFDVKAASLVPLAAEYPHLSNAPLGQTRLVTYPSKDGTTIRAFLTLPAGKSKNLPLVVLPHGGPEVRDIAEFDPLFVQALAAQGYAVIQPQFRGSSGFGKAFADAGRLKWGTAVLDDIAGAVDYAAGQGVADPKRVCIVGGSFGGYAALASAALRPGVYACAVGLAGVYDLVEFLRYERDEDGEASFDYWSKQIGKLTADNSAIDAMSPAKNAGAITVPVLLISGDKDDVVPIAQTEIMTAALKAAGNVPQVVVLPGENHYLERYESRVLYLRSLLPFLQAHIGG